MGSLPILVTVTPTVSATTAPSRPLLLSIVPTASIVYAAFLARGAINLGSTSDLTVSFGFGEG